MLILVWEVLFAGNRANIKEKFTGRKTKDPEMQNKDALKPIIPTLNINIIIL